MIARDGARLVVHGPLTMATAATLFAEGLQQLSSGDLLVDFSQVETVDSAAVSLLLGWERAAQRGQYKLHVAGMPENLLSLARLYGVDDMLPSVASQQ